MRHIIRLPELIVQALFFCLTIPASAALDPNFADQGMSSPAIGMYDDRITGMAVLPDGSVVAVGTQPILPTATWPWSVIPRTVNWILPLTAMAG